MAEASEQNAPVEKSPARGWFSLTLKPGALRLRAQPEPKPGNLYEAPWLLLQKFPAPEFTITTKLEFAPKADSDRAGLIVFGYDYAWIGLQRVNGSYALVLAIRPEAARGEPERETTALAKVSGPVWLRVTVRAGGKCRFSYSLAGEKFAPVGDGDFTATVGKWVGAKVGLFATSGPVLPSAQIGHADFDFFRVTP